MPNFTFFLTEKTDLMLNELCTKTGYSRSDLLSKLIRFNFLLYTAGFKKIKRGRHKKICVEIPASENNAGSDGK